MLPTCSSSPAVAVDRSSRKWEGSETTSTLTDPLRLSRRTNQVNKKSLFQGFVGHDRSAESRDLFAVGRVCELG
jgi:hypothetical protein